MVNILEDLGLESLSTRREHHVVKLVTACLQGSCHPALEELFSLTSNGRVEVTQPRTVMGKRSFKFLGATLYNASQ